MLTDQERWNKSFYGKLRLVLDNRPLNFSRVDLTTETTHTGGDRYHTSENTNSGYKATFFNYLTANSFEDDAYDFYFRYSDEDDSFSISTRAKEWLTISNNGYLYLTPEPTYCKHFRLLSSDRSKRLSLADMTEEQNEIIIQVISIDYVWDGAGPNHAGDHKWSYMIGVPATPTNGCKLKLSITRRGVEGYID
jgi:hypothetical protein